MKLNLLRVALCVIIGGAILFCCAPSFAAEILVTQGYTIGAYNTSGATINASFITGLAAPLSFNESIVASANNVFVVNGTFTGQVGEYTLAGATVNPALIYNQFSIIPPTPLAVAGNDLWGYGDNSQFQPAILEWNMSGAVIGSITLPEVGTPNSYSVAPPGDIAVSGGDVFVEFGTTVSEWTTSGTLVNASLITVPSTTFIEGMAVSGSNIFLTNTAQGNQPPTGDWVSEYTTSGALVNASLISGLALPEEIAVYGGNLYVSGLLPSSGNDFGIAEYTTSGTSVNPAVLTLPFGGFYTTNNEAFVIIPEPASWVLAAVGLLGLVFAARRR